MRLKRLGWNRLCVLAGIECQVGLVADGLNVFDFGEADLRWTIRGKNTGTKREAKTESIQPLIIVRSRNPPGL